MKYNYVIFAGDYDYNRILFNDIMDREDIKYNDGVGGPYSPVRLAHRIHTSPKVNRMLFDLPGKEKWYGRYWTGAFSDDKPVCMVFHASYLLTRFRFNDYLTYLKARYPDVRMVLFYEDLVGSFDRSIWPDAVRDKFDLMLSYDIEEARKYGLRYYPTVASKISVPYNPAIRPSDVYLLAFAKDRFHKYLSIYEYLTGNGISCDFNILGVPESERRDNGIRYLDRPVPYLENLQHVSATKCILDIRQQNSTGFTLRLWEAILYDRKLISDNAFLARSEFYDERFISLVTDGKPDISFIRSAPDFTDTDKGRVSPVRFFEHLDTLLQP